MNLATPSPNTSRQNQASRLGELLPQAIPSTGQTATLTTLTSHSENITSTEKAKKSELQPRDGMPVGALGAGRTAQSVADEVKKTWDTLLPVRRSWTLNSANTALMSEEHQALTKVLKETEWLLTCPMGNTLGMRELLRLCQTFLTAFPFGVSMTDTSRNNLLLWNWVDALEKYPLWATRAALEETRNTCTKGQPLIADVINVVASYLGVHFARLNEAKGIIRDGKVWESREVYNAHLRKLKDAEIEAAAKAKAVVGEKTKAFIERQEKRKAEIEEEDRQRAALKLAKAEESKLRHERIGEALKAHEKRMTRHSRYMELWTEMDKILTEDVEDWKMIKEHLT